MSTAACSATGIRSRLNSAFSCSRSCETSRAARGGRIVVSFSRGASAAPEMFSQSKVITSLVAASSASRAASSRSTYEDGSDLRAGRIGASIQKAAADAQWVARKRQHAPQLPGTDDADL